VSLFCAGATGAHHVPGSSFYHAVWSVQTVQKVRELFKDSVQALTRRIEFLSQEIIGE